MKKLTFVFFIFFSHQITAQRLTLQKNSSTSAQSVTTSASYKFNDHPRLFFSKKEEGVILQKAKQNVLLSQLIEVLRKEADKELVSLPQKYIPDVQLLQISREQIKRLITLSMAYRLLNDVKYAKKAEEEILNVCSFPSWHPEHFLDVAEMTTAVAIGYDWCFDYLSPATRKTAEDAIREKAFAPAWPIYESTNKKTPFNRENNWNMVCNSGMVTGAIAIGDQYPEEVKRVVDYAVKYTPNLLESFAPEGVFNEGPGYWAYNGMYMSLFFDNLIRNIHNDFGLPAMAGLNNTARFYMSIIGPTNEPFNFGDASEKVDRSGTFFFLSKYYKQPDVATFYRNLIQSALQEYNNKGRFEFPRFFFLSIPWFDDAKVTNAASNKKLETFKGVTDFIIINGSGKSDSNRLYLAAKTGKPSWSHNQLDVGSFVVDCDGERWGIDLGADTYSLPDFWDYKPGGVRWNYFRNSNLSHNTLSIDDQITNSDGQGELTRFNNKSAAPFGVFDLTAAYQGEASAVFRGFKLLSPKTILIRDEVTLKPGSKKITWRFLTNAAVNINAGTATLSQNGKEFYIRCLLPGGFTMQTTAAKPNSPAEKPIKGVNIVEISISPSDGKTAIPVLIGSDIEQIKKGITNNAGLNKWR